MESKLIVITGPGASGKSFMTDRLANYYAFVGNTFQLVRWDCHEDREDLADKLERYDVVVVEMMDDRQIEQLPATPWQIIRVERPRRKGGEHAPS